MKLIGGANIMRLTRAQRLKWWGHLHRMEGGVQNGMEDFLMESNRREIKRTPNE
jgi:hypothetical protein